ncbi:MAG: nucleotidyltransferase family protein [Dehalococcoidia bacterium]|nr:nucleotidyltransferase family protein [Dehalococcoidia bacterium]
MRLVALLMAAGESTRMGSPKPLLPWDNRTLVEYQISQLLEGGAERVIVVLGHAADVVRPHIPTGQAEVVVNHRYREGRASSVRAGASAISEGVEAITILGVDQPRPSSVIRTVIDAHFREGAIITVPTYEGRRGHPTVFDGSLLQEMLNVSEENLGLREIMTRHATEITEVEVSSPLVLADLNTPNDYQRVKALITGGE